MDLGAVMAKKSKRDKLLVFIIGAVNEKARRVRQFSKPDGGKTYQRCLEAVALLNEIRDEPEVLPLFAMRKDAH